MNSADFDARLAGFFDGRGASGCGQEEIDELARRYNAWLPADYISFLRRAGKVAPRLWSGSDFTLDHLDGMQGAAGELLGAVGLGLPLASFVFLMHQGYQFLFLCDNGVFYFCEGKPNVERRFGSFAEFFEATAESW